MEYTKTEKQFIHELNSYLQEPLEDKAVLVLIRLLRKYADRGEFVKKVIEVRYKTKFVSNINSIKTNKISLKTILECVSKEIDIPIELMKTKKRDTEIVLARKIYYYFSRIYTNYPLRLIAKELSYQDHTTLCHAVQSLLDRMETDLILTDKINKIKIILDSYEKQYQ